MFAEVKTFGFSPKPYLQSTNECMNNVAENELLKNFPLGKYTLRGRPQKMSYGRPHMALYATPRDVPYRRPEGVLYLRL